MDIKFALGKIVATPGFLTLLDGDEKTTGELLTRHATGDWGEVCDEDKQVNEDALREGDRLMSAYTVKGKKVWIVTEHDRSVTTLLLPDEY